MIRPDDVPQQPDGPTPAREQLPLPRRRRQGHLDAHLREPGNTGSRFTPFSPEATGEMPTFPSGERPVFSVSDKRGFPTGEMPVFPAEDPHASPGRPPTAADRVAAFRAGMRRGTGRPVPPAAPANGSADQAGGHGKHDAAETGKRRRRRAD